MERIVGNNFVSILVNTTANLTNSTLRLAELNVTIDVPDLFNIQRQNNDDDMGFSYSAFQNEGFFLSQRSRTVVTPVVDFTLNNATIEKLDRPINITFPIREPV